jgi:hypothetical protein
MPEREGDRKAVTELCKAIDAFSEAVAALLGSTVTPGTLAEDYGVLGSSPAWKEVAGAVSEVYAVDRKSARTDAWPVREDDDSSLIASPAVIERIRLQQTLEDYIDMLERWAPTFQHALVIATTVGLALQYELAADRRRLVFESWRSLLELPSISTSSGVSAVLGQVSEQDPKDARGNQLESNTPRPALAVDPREGVREWVDALRRECENLDMLWFRPEAKRRARAAQDGNMWQDRLRILEEVGTLPVRLNLDDLVLAAIGDKVANALHSAGRKQTIAAWSEVLRAASDDLTTASVPAIARRVVTSHLGLDSSGRQRGSGQFDARTLMLVLPDRQFSNVINWAVNPRYAMYMLPPDSGSGFEPPALLASKETPVRGVLCVERSSRASAPLTRPYGMNVVTFDTDSRLEGPIEGMQADGHLGYVQGAEMLAVKLGEFLRRESDVTVRRLLSKLLALMRAVFSKGP